MALTSRSSMQANGVTYTNNTSGNEGADVYDDRSGSAPRGARPRPQAPAPGPQPGAAANRPAGFEPGGGFTVMTVGTGAPQYDPERSGPSALVQYQGSYMLVDTGNGAQARLNEAGVPVGRINALMLTHHHLDHIEEFLPLLINVRLRNARVSVIGPPGTKRFVDFIMDFFSEDIAYRLGRGGRTLDDLGQAAVREVSGGESFNLGEVRVTTVRVNHTIHTVAYRFDVDGQSIVISGDLSYSESLSELARDAAVLVIDAGGVIKKNAGAGQRRPQRRQPPAGAGNAPRPVRAHSSLSEVATMAQKAGADRLVLTHITPGQIDEEATLQAIGKIYRGEVIIGHDLLEVSPPKR
ncbi:MAG: MBL fold metallo-hydrolase [bacterium]|nr:MBL fold metallo-hydrolase [bacterium]